MKSSNYFRLALGCMLLGGWGTSRALTAQVEGESPVFSQSAYTLGIVPGVAANSVLGRVTAVDPQSDALSYRIDGSALFSIDAAGDIRNIQQLNYNLQQSHTFQVVASDGAHERAVDVSVRFLQGMGVQLERWLAISGSDLQDLTGSAHFQDNAPDLSELIAQLDVPDTGISRFGQRLTAILVPSQSGVYTFGLTSDDASECRLALSGNAADRVSVARFNGWTSYQNWSSAQESAPVALEAGHAYYIEILHKEGSGGDHVSLGWKLSGATTYTLIPETVLFSDYLSLEDSKPAFQPHATEYLIPGTTAIGEPVANLAATDAQGDPLSYAVVGTVPFAVDSQGILTLSQALPTAGANYQFAVTVSDGTHTISTSLSIRSTAASAVEDALQSGSVDAVTAEELLDAALSEILRSQDLLLAEKRALFQLNADGSAKQDGSSLTNIDWNPTQDAMLLQSTYGINTPVLFTNAVIEPEYTVKSRELAIMGDRPGRYMVMGSHPMRNWYRNELNVNTEMHQFLKRTLEWLTRRTDLETADFHVVIAHQSQYFPDQVAPRTWLDTHYPNTVHYNVAGSANNTALQAALASQPDLLILSQMDGTAIETVAAAVESALEAGVGVLYLQHDGGMTDLGEALFSVFNVHRYGHNYWRKLQLVDYDATAIDFQSLPENMAAIQTMLTHLKHQDYAFDWTLADGEDVSAVPELQASYLDGAKAVRAKMTAWDEAGVNLFENPLYRFDQLLALLGDSYRSEVRFPMDKESTDDDRFLKAYFADHAVYHYRTINPAQTDMGNFSRSDFSHITPTSKTIQLQSKRYFRSAGVYALPGQTVRVTRLDHSAVSTGIFVNTQRSGSTHQWASEGYTRPKYLKSPQMPIAPGETITFTSPYGGPLQVAFDTNNLEVELRFENIGEHPYWRGTQDDLSFSQKLDAAEYDWAEIATPAFEVHSSLEKMNISVANWDSAKQLSDATLRYLHNFPHVLAGFQGPGIDVLDEIHSFAALHGWTIETLDLVKHMNADQATCGYGCSGNPYDAYWSFGPTAHGDLHELGHGLEKSRFRMPGWSGHSTTNLYSYYAKTQYYKDTGLDPECQELPFEYVFNQLVASASADDPVAWLQAQLWADSGWSQQVVMLIQLMMVAQNQAVIEDGWNIYARLHMLDREFNRVDNDETQWLSRRDSIGFSQYAYEDARNLNNIDWMVIASSFVTGLDYRDFFEMYGYVPSSTAAAQVASFGYPKAPKVFCLSTNVGYCKGQGFNAMVLPVATAQEWPLETDTDGDQQWDVFDADDDNDLMSDDFELRYGLDPLDPNDATQNADADSMDNRSEYIAGTSPVDPNSYFKASLVGKPTLPSKELRWDGVAGRLYSVWGAEQLSHNFFQIRAPKLSDGSPQSFTDAEPRPSQFFYKVLVELPSP